jgi:type IV secretory pathway VirB10-like protein
MNRRCGVIILALTLALTACTTANTADRDEALDLANGKRESQPAKITLPAGTPLRVVLQTGVGSDTSTPGGEFSAVLADPVVIDGKTVLEKGTAVVGRVTDVKKSGRVK